MSTFETTVIVGRSDSPDTVSLEIDQNPFTIGSSPYNDVVLNDHYVSRKHARVIVARGKLRFKDTSSNGSYHQGKRIDEMVLESGDVVQIPPFSLRFEYSFEEPRSHTVQRPIGELLAEADDARVASVCNDEVRKVERQQAKPSPKPAASPKRERSATPEKPQRSGGKAPVLSLSEELSIDSPTIPSSHFADARDRARDAITAKSSQAPKDSPPRDGSTRVLTALVPLEVLRAEPDFWLAVTDGPEGLNGEKYPFAGDREATVGRGEGADFSFEIGSISRVHAKLTPRGDGSWILKDLGSTNGTYVGGRKIDQTIVTEDQEFRLADSIAFRITKDLKKLDQETGGSRPARGALDAGGVSRDFRVSAERAGNKGSILVVNLEGRLDAYNYTELSELLRQALDDGDRLIVVELSKLVFIDHTGLGVLVRTSAQLEQMKGGMRLVGLSKKLREALALSRLDTVFRNKIAVDRDSAIEALTSAPVSQSFFNTFRRSRE